MTIAGLHDFVKVSISASLKSFLLNICIDAPESTTNSLSSSLRVDASKHLFSEGEKNVALSCSFKLNIFLARFHAASRAPYSCHSVSSWDRSSNFGALELRWWGSPGKIIPSEGLWSRIFAWPATTLMNSTRRIGFCMSENFRIIVDNLSGTISWKTQPTCPVFDEWTFSRGRPVLWWYSFFFNMDIALLSPFCLYLLLNCSSTWRCACEHFSRNLQPLSVL